MTHSGSCSPWRILAAVAYALVRISGAGLCQDTNAVRLQGDSVSVRFLDTDLRAVVEALAPYLSKPIIMAPTPPTRISLDTPHPVPPASLRAILAGLLESQGLSLTEDSVSYHIGPRPATPSGHQVGQGAGSAQPPRLFVIRLKHARAVDVAATVNLLFGGPGEFAGGGGLSGGSLADQLKQNVVPPQLAGPPSSNPPASPGPVPQRPSSLEGPVTIVPDELTNSLLVRAGKEDFDVVSEAVEQLDIRPLQVLVEVLIVEARSDRSFSLGADIFVPPQNIGGDGTIEAASTGGGLGDLVVKIMKLGHADINSTIRAAQSRGDVEIISRPVLLASNNTEAYFLVGSQRPFVQVSRSLPTETPTRDQVVQYKDVGTKLTIRPTINQDGYVSLLIRQEINAATEEVQFDAPVISTREATTQVLVRDSQTIMLGGLRDRQRDKSQSGVPILSQIPILGGLFGTASRHSTRTELYLFLTPRILKTDADADSVTAPHLPHETSP